MAMTEIEDKQSLKIGIIGSHGVGKTTFALDLAQQMQKTGKFSVSVLTELARECPYPLGVNQSSAATNWLITRQISRELELMRNSSVLVCDRTSLDALVYTQASGHISLKEVVLESSVQWLTSYDLLIWIRPSGELVDDGFRMLDHGFRQKVDEVFAQYLTKLDNLEEISQAQVMRAQTRHDFFIQILQRLDTILEPKIVREEAPVLV